jgi:hypothetical protein
MIQKDKVKHIVVSFVLCIFMGAFNLPFGILMTLAIGIGKEVWDKESGRGTADIYDILADFIGVLIASALILISNSL